MSSQSTTLLNGRVKLIQSIDGLRASMDSVLLAASANPKAGEHVLDMGCGTGAVGLCVKERLSDLDLSITGIDIQDSMIDLAKQNMVDETMQYHVGDIHDKSFFKAEEFDYIVMNPPYYAEGERQKSPDPAREKAYSGELDCWMASALHWVRQGGSVSIIHRADRLDKILNIAQGKFGAIEIWPIHSKLNEPAIRIIVRMIRNRKSPLILHPAIVLFNEQGEQSDAAINILRRGQGL